MSHSILPPSSAGIWGKPDGCTGWVMMNQMYPETEEGVEAKEGTASHEIGAERLVGLRDPVEDSAENWVGTTAGNGVIITEDMFDGAMLYADDVIAVEKLTGCKAVVEQRVDIPAVHALNWGTPDARLFHPGGNTLYVWDYKFGFEPHEAFEHWQSIEYTAGILDELEINGCVDQYTKVCIRIVQPRAHHRDGVIREWVILASDLRAHINILNTNAHIALGPDATFHTGEHCKHCPGRHACAPALRAGMGLFEVTAAPLPVELSPETVGVQLSIIKRARKQLEYLESGFEEQVKGLIRGGKLVPGWSTEEGIGHPKWSKPATEVVAMGDMLDFDLRKPISNSTIMTPIQSKKLGIDEGVINAYSFTPSTGLKIVPDNGNKAKQVFSK